MDLTIRRRAARLIAVAAVAGLTAACGTGSSSGSGSSGADADLTLTVWTANAAQLATLNQIASGFSSSHNGVKVTIQSVPQSDYVTKLSVRLAGGDAPDLGWLGSPDLTSFAAAGRLVDLKPTLSTDAAYQLPDYLPAAIKTWQVGSALYGVPFSTSPFFTLYNKDDFARAGLPDPAAMAAQGQWTWAKLAQIAPKLQASLPSGAYAFESSGDHIYDQLGWTTLDPLLRAYGAKVYDPAKKQCVMDSPQAAHAIQLYQQMAFSDHTAVPPGAVAKFAAGKAAVTLAQLSSLGSLKGAGFKWGVATLPAGPGGQPYVTGQAGWVVFKGTKHQKLATQLLAYLTNQASTKTLAQYYPPARQSVLNDAAQIYAGGPIPADVISSVLVAGITRGTPFDYPSNWPQVRATAQPVLDKLWSPGAKTPSILHELCAQLNPVLAKSK